MGITIAVVDDHESMRKAIIRTLKRSGLDIEAIYEAGNGQEALATFSKFNIDFAIVDLSMPVMNGIEMIDRLRGGDETRRIPCIFISGENDREKVEIAAGKGVGFIQKPFSQTTLAETIFNMLLRPYEKE